VVVANPNLGIGQTSQVTITFSEAVSGLDLATSAWQRHLSNLSSSDGGKTWTATLTPTAGITDTSNLITLNNTGYVDGAGNSGIGTAISNSYAIDTLDPVAPEITLDQATLVNGRQVSPTGLVFISGLEAGGSWQYSWTMAFPGLKAAATPSSYRVSGHSASGFSKRTRRAMHPR
jgi:hypothetical protein